MELSLVSSEHIEGASSLLWLSVFASASFELPLLACQGIRLEGAFVDADDQYLIMHELGKQSTNVEPLLVVARVPVLELALVGLLVAKAEGLPKNLGDGC